MKKTRPLVLLLASLMVLSMVLAGCTPDTDEDMSSVETKTSSETKTDATTDDSTNEAMELEPVVLKMVLLGNKPNDLDLVFDEVNAILSDKVNATLDIDYIPWSDFMTKYQLLFSSGEEWDIVYTATWTPPPFKVLAAKDAFLELTPEMLQEYAPQTWANTPEVAFKQVMLDGKIFTIPSSNDEYGKHIALIRGDLRKKYDLPEVNSPETLIDYINTIAQNEEGITTYDCGSNGQGLEDVLFMQPNDYYRVNNQFGMLTVPDSKLMRLDDPEYIAERIEYYKLVRSLVESGAISSDAASQSTARPEESFKAGIGAMTTWNIINSSVLVDGMINEHPEWEPEMVDISPEVHTYVQQYSNNGTAISVTSENWERALMVIDLLRNDKELWDLSNYGIVGTHWEPIGEDRYTSLEASVNFPPNSSCQWGWNTHLIRTPDNWPQQSYDLLDSWVPQKVEFLANGFAMDVTKVKSQEAAISNLITEFVMPLLVGGFEDPEKAYMEFLEKAEKAGLDEYYDELQIQLDAYIALIQE